MKFRTFTLLVTLAACFGLAGCNLPIDPSRSDAVRYFTLSAPAAAATTGGVRVQPVQTAGHLHPREIAVRVGESEVVYLDEARWAEIPAEGMTSRLRAALAGVAADGTLRVEVSRCEPDRAAGNTVVFQAGYTFFPAGGGTAVSGTFTANARKWDGRDVAALVGLYREALDEFGVAIAAALSRK
jgi:ABC-type uncharacterized transport system auxiliary subunit